MQLAMVINRTVTKRVSKTFIIFILIGFITLSIIWLPKNTNSKIQGNNQAQRIDAKQEQSNIVINDTKMFGKEFKETITWIIGVFNSFLIGLLTLKKLLVKGA